MSLSKPEELLVNELSCPICFQLFSNPLLLPCGHSYCQACIQKTADAFDKSANVPPRCPECREGYPSVDTLQKNFKLCSIIEGYLATAPPLLERPPQTAPEMAPETSPKMPPETSQILEVYCDNCIDESTLAVKTCLKCEVSLCSRHLQRHHDKESFKAHTLVEPEKGARGCAVHRRSLEYFCSSDMMPLCTTCLVEGHHKSHDILTFSAAEEEMRHALQSRSKVISCRLQMTENLLQKTIEEQGASEATGDRLVNKAVSVMDSMASLVDRYRERLRSLTEEERGQCRKSWQLGLGELEEKQQQLQEAQRLAIQALNLTDTCDFIHRFMLIEAKLRSVVSGNIPSKIPTKAPLTTKRLQEGLKTQDFRMDMTRLLDSLCVILNPLDLIFNLCTAHPSLLVSKDLHTVKYNPTKQSYAEHPERFMSAPQVLCSQGFSGGEHVWAVEVGTNCMWSVGVCYKSIPRRGDHSRLGHNSVSWRLQWKNGKLTACQSTSNVALGEVAHHPMRIEVALDYEGGTLKFHSTKGRREHLYTFRAVFREQVFPAFSIHSNTAESWITLQSGM